jgi:TonB family protein
MRNAMKTSVTILTLLLLTSISGRLLACSCIGQRTVEEEVKHADAVIVGTILSKQIVTLTDSAILKMFPNDTTMRNSPMSKMTIARYDFLVQDIYKGKITKDTLTIYTGRGGGDCGTRFEIGKKYIVYGENETYFGQVNNDFKFPKAKNTFWTYNCLRTTSYFQDEITEIEKYAKRKHIDKAEVIFADPDSPPTFKDGGDIGLKKFIKENLRYPKTGECVTGKVYVGFTVDTLGNVKDIEIKRGITPSTDEEAIRVVKMLTFIPGTRFGRPIETKMVLPISFTIEYKDDK